MTYIEARIWALWKIAKVESPSPQREEQLGRLDDWDLANVFYRHFGYDWQARITN